MEMEDNHVQTKNPSARDRSFVVDPTGLAPVSSSGNTDMLLYAPRARAHKCMIKQKDPSFKESFCATRL